MHGDDDWWPLSAALCWIAMRQPLPFASWPDDLLPPQLGPSSFLADDVRLPEGVKQRLAKQDDGIDAGLAALSAVLMAAAGSGQVAVRGRGPWALRPPADSMIVSKSSASEAPLRHIAPEEFTRRAIAISPSIEQLGPGEDRRWPEDNADAAIDIATYPRWLDVEVSAADLRARWRVEGNTGHAPDQPLSSAISEAVQLLPDDDSAAKPRATHALIGGWMAMRVARWRATEPRPQPPTEAELRAEADREFEGVTRVMIRSTRARVAPPEWNRIGRRPQPVRRDS